MNRLGNFLILFILVFMTCSCSQVKHFSDFIDLSANREKYFDNKVILDAVVHVDEEGSAKACSSQEQDNCIYLALPVETYNSIKSMHSVNATIHGTLKEHTFIAEGDDLKMLPSRIVVDELELKQR